MELFGNVYLNVDEYLHEGMLPYVHDTCQPRHGQLKRRSFCWCWENVQLLLKGAVPGTSVTISSFKRPQPIKQFKGNKHHEREQELWTAVRSLVEDENHVLHNARANFVILYIEIQSEIKLRRCMHRINITLKTSPQHVLTGFIFVTRDNLNHLSRGRYKILTKCKQQRQQQ